MSQANPTIDLEYALADKFAHDEGRVYLSGIDALVRLPMMQAKRDRAAGLDTAGFISGYRGSPLGGYDAALWRMRDMLADHAIRFQPGVNEDLAATAVWGTQQTDLYGDATVDGVFSIWYGKSPGVDRSLDPIKHANMAGCSKHGGVLMLAGDDHGCQSSTLPNQSDLDLISAGVPILNPSGVADILEHGMLGFALSRFASVWTALKLVVETVESTASLDLDAIGAAIRIPEDFAMPPGGLAMRWPDTPADMEARLFGPRLRAVEAFARANAIDRIEIAPDHPRLGIVTTGKAYLDVRQALADLGIDDRTAAELGIRLYKVGMPWPMEPQGMRGFAEGLREILVVEEKRAVIEPQLVRLLYGRSGDRPGVVGKRDEEGAVLFPEIGEIDSALVARRLVERLARLGPIDPALAARAEALQLKARPVAPLRRTPFFCSGCPHNSSTVVPDGSRSMAGIGCHGMAIWMPDRKAGPNSHMGGEGLHWVGQAPFSKTRHVFQNLGDGTYSHSGLLAIRAAALAGVNITYKILFNDAVAMTGGQPVEGELTVAQITHQVASEGARRIVVVSDEPDKYGANPGFADGVTIHHRGELDDVQRSLRDTPGLTVLIYDQACAAEKRRRRKRGKLPDPPKRLFINEAVCEGCGDCSVKSNCISVQPLETEFGRKRMIDQSNCNKDYSCREGFCPSFVTVHGGRPRKASPAGDPEIFAHFPEPTAAAFDRPYNILVTGIGGTGVITIGQILGMAAHLEGKGVNILDNTGLAQKNGSVMSHVRIAPGPADVIGARIAANAADLVLGCDIVTTASPAALRVLGAGSTHLVLNRDSAPVADFVRSPDFDLDTGLVERILTDAVGADRADFLPASRLALKVTGDTLGANMLLLGFAFQKGLVPLSAAAIDRATVLNGAAVEANRRAFAWGRLAAHDPAAVERLLEPVAANAAIELSGEALTAHRSAALVAYQDESYAARYRALVERARQAEARIGAKGASFGDGVARSLFKLMAYKDEYEVGRLYADPAFRERLTAQFEGDVRLSFHLAPPILAGKAGAPRKIEFGAWTMGLFRLLARFKRVRGTWLDPFGRTAERRRERRDIEDYVALVARLADGLTRANHATAAALAELPLQIRGFGHVKDANRETVEARRKELLKAFDSPPADVARSLAEVS